MRPRSVLTLSLAGLALGLAGCGQENSPQEALRRVAPLALQEARARVAAPPTPPILSAELLGTDLLPGTRAVRIGEKQKGLRDAEPTQVAAQIRGRMRTRVRLTITPGAERYVREIPPGGLVATLERPFAADAARDGQSWVLAETDDPLTLGDYPAPEPTRGERREALRRARGAVRALLTYRGDRGAYARAQEPYYLTRRADPEGGLPGLDAPPRLAQRDGTGGISPEPLGAVWARTEARQDDLQLGEVLPLTKRLPRDLLCGDQIRLRSMSVRDDALRAAIRDDEPAAETPDDGAAPTIPSATQELRVDGEAVVVLRDWRCETSAGTKEDYGPDDVRLRFRITLQRVAIGAVRTDWLVSGVRLRRGGTDGGDSPVLYATDLQR